jgi:hypothetical protein
MKLGENQCSLEASGAMEPGRARAPDGVKETSLDGTGESTGVM